MTADAMYTRHIQMDRNARLSFTHNLQASLPVVFNVILYSSRVEFDTYRDRSD